MEVEDEGGGFFSTHGVVYSFLQKMLADDWPWLLCCYLLQYTKYRGWSKEHVGNNFDHDCFIKIWLCTVIIDWVCQEFQNDSRWDTFCLVIFLYLCIKLFHFICSLWTLRLIRVRIFISMRAEDGSRKRRCRITQRIRGVYSRIWT